MTVFEVEHGSSVDDFDVKCERAASTSRNVLSDAEKHDSDEFDKSHKIAKFMEVEVGKSQNTVVFRYVCERSGLYNCAMTPKWPFVDSSSGSSSSQSENHNGPTVTWTKECGGNRGIHVHSRDATTLGEMKLFGVSTLLETDSDVDAQEEDSDSEEDSEKLEKLADAEKSLEKQSAKAEEKDTVEKGAKGGKKSEKSKKEKKGYIVSTHGFQPDQIPTQVNPHADRYTKLDKSIVLTIIFNSIISFLSFLYWANYFVNGSNNRLTIPPEGEYASFVIETDGDKTVELESKPEVVILTNEKFMNAELVY